MNPENKKSLTLEYTSYSPAAIAVIIGVALVFNTDFNFETHDKALLWFVFVLLAIKLCQQYVDTHDVESYLKIDTSKANSKMSDVLSELSKPDS